MAPAADSIVDELIAFLVASPTAFHATDTACRMLQEEGFQKLEESASWDQLPSGAYYITRNDSSLVCWRQNGTGLPLSGWRMLCAHTDSPSLKLKPRPLLAGHGCLRLAVEIYGSPLLTSWFDRELSLAGRISWQDAHGGLHDSLLDLRRPLAILPSLAVHLERDGSTPNNPDRQLHMNPIFVAGESDQPQDVQALLRPFLTGSATGASTGQLLDHDLFFYDTALPCRLGLHDELLAGGRLDNLVSCFLGLKAMLDPSVPAASLLVLHDHEEIGSQSLAGALGTLLESVLHRLYPQPDLFYRCMARSCLLSLDNAHGVHPNFADRAEPQHAPQLNRGPVLKHHAGQRYATCSPSAAHFRAACARAGVPLQDYVVHSGLRCGSTMGPLLSSRLGLVAADAGVASLAMHSIRETAGCADIVMLGKAIAAFLRPPACEAGS